MKRIIIALTVLSSVSFISAQTIFEASRSSQSDIRGAARYMGVAGAFGALGGDVSAIKDNPAGLGVFRKSELTVSFAAGVQDVDSKWYDQETNEHTYKAKLNNFGLVFASKTWRAESGYSGLLSSNFSFNYNKIADFNRTANILGGQTNKSMTDYFAAFTGMKTESQLLNANYEPYYNNTGVSWMSAMACYGGLIREHNNSSGDFDGWQSFLSGVDVLSPAYYIEERGGIDEYSFGWSGNFSNRFYVGATFNWKNLDYSMYSSYNEKYVNLPGSVTDRNIQLDNWLNTTGKGFDVGFGVIAVPLDFLRLGLSVKTPTFYKMSQNNFGKLYFTSDLYNGNTGTPEDNYLNYKLQTPLQFNISAAFISGKKGLLSAEYVYRDYKNMKFVSVDGYNFIDENTYMKNMFKNSRTIKVGAEYRLTDNFSVRGGYANTSSLTENNAQKILSSTTIRTDPEYFTHDYTNYFSLGFGYRESDWYADVTYSNVQNKGSYFSYNPNVVESSLFPSYKADPADVTTKEQNLTFTFGFKF